VFGVNGAGVEVRSLQPVERAYSLALKAAVHQSDATGDR
jgi:hypothetical protein